MNKIVYLLLLVAMVLVVTPVQAGGTKTVGASMPPYKCASNWVAVITGAAPPVVGFHYYVPSKLVPWDGVTHSLITPLTYQYNGKAIYRINGDPFPSSTTQWVTASVPEEWSGDIWIKEAPRTHCLEVMVQGKREKTQGFRRIER
jgi:hypothetical protein